MGCTRGGPACRAPSLCEGDASGIKGPRYGNRGYGKAATGVEAGMAAARSAPTPGPSPGATRTSLGEGRGSEPRYGNRGYGKAATGEEAGMTAAGSAPTPGPSPGATRTSRGRGAISIRGMETTATVRLLRARRRAWLRWGPPLSATNRA